MARVSTFHMTRGSITDHVLKHATRYSVTVTETGNAFNALKRSLLGRGFADHGNLLAKLEKASSQVLTADLKQRLYYVFFCRTNKVLYIVLINKYSCITKKNLTFFLNTVLYLFRVTESFG